MSNNSYDDFKYGIKKDIRGLAINTFGGFGALLLIFTMLMVLGYVFYPHNQCNDITKIITSIIVVILVVILIFNSKVASVIYTYWLVLIIVVFMAILAIVVGWIIYSLFKGMMRTE